jgi:hypothetical protein
MNRKQEERSECEKEGMYDRGGERLGGAEGREEWGAALGLGRQGRHSTLQLDKTDRPTEMGLG